MPPEDVEKLLKSIPVRSLSAAADEEIVRRLRAAAVRSPWWRRPIPLWQAAAACLAFALISGVALEIGRDKHPLDRAQPAPTVSPDPASLRKTVFVELDPPLFPQPVSAADRLDVSSWTFVRSESSRRIP